MLWCGTHHGQRQGNCGSNAHNDSRLAGCTLGMARQARQACHAPRDRLQCETGERLVISMPLGLTRKEIRSRVRVEHLAVMRVLGMINKTALGFIFSKTGMEMVKMSRGPCTGLCGQVHLGLCDLQCVPSGLWGMAPAVTL